MDSTDRVDEGVDLELTPRRALVAAAVDGTEPGEFDVERCRELRVADRIELEMGVVPEGTTLDQLESGEVEIVLMPIR